MCGTQGCKVYTTYHEICRQTSGVANGTTAPSESKSIAGVCLMWIGPLELTTKSKFSVRQSRFDLYVLLT